MRNFFAHVCDTQTKFIYIFFYSTVGNGENLVQKKEKAQEMKKRIVNFWFTFFFRCSFSLPFVISHEAYKLNNIVFTLGITVMIFAVSQMEISFVVL